MYTIRNPINYRTKTRHNSIHSLPRLVLLCDTDWDRWGSTRVHKLFTIAVYICLRPSVLAICYLPTATLMWGGTGQLMGDDGVYYRTGRAQGKCQYVTLSNSVTY
jgi:hypothetical protein